MKRYLLLLLVVAVIGCGGGTPLPDVDNTAASNVSATQRRDSTAAAYWKCSATKKLYMQKYVRTDGGQWRPAGAFKLGEGIGAFPLEDLDKYRSDGDTVSIDVGNNPCPHCNNPSLGQCRCGKTHCLEPLVGSRITATCPWCGSRNTYTPGTWTVGGDG